MALGRRDVVPDWWPYTESELLARMRTAGAVHGGNWGGEVWSFAPAYGLWHIPDGLYPVVSRLLRWCRGGLVIGVARREAPSR